MIFDVFFILAAMVTGTWIVWAFPRQELREYLKIRRRGRTWLSE